MEEGGGFPEQEGFRGGGDFGPVAGAEFVAAFGEGEVGGEVTDVVFGVGGDGGEGGLLDNV